jgi:hypothetical protein
MSSGVGGVYAQLQKSLRRIPIRDVARRPIQVALIGVINTAINNAIAVGGFTRIVLFAIALRRRRPLSIRGGVIQS